MLRRFFLFASAPALFAQQARTVEFFCPMDPEVRAAGPGKCPRCGMALVPGIPEPVEYALELRVSPPQIPARKRLVLEFRVRDPRTRRQVKKFEVVHEKLFHLFLVRHDLEYFAHEHPEPQPDGTFRLPLTLPSAGAYRLLADFYPRGGTPQLLPRTIITAGYTRALEESIPKLEPDLQPRNGRNVRVELKCDPPRPLVGKKTMMFFRLTPAEGLEQYIGAWGHMLAASADLVDTIHAHPFLADGGPEMQFNMYFPRAGMYRVWVQFQRRAVVNTVAFTVPVARL